jgi:ABC-type phosphate transport system permease subunit
MGKVLTVRGRVVGIVAGVSAAIYAASFFGGAEDSNVAASITALQSFVTANFPAIISGVVGIVLMIWGIRLLLHSTGAKKPTSVT